MEVGALMADRWTGTATIVAALAEEALRDAAIDWSFMVDTILLPRPLLAHMLARRTGVDAREALAALAWGGGEMPRAPGDRACGLFTGIKPARGRFAREAMFIHDLGPLLAPRYEDAAGIARFADHVRGDIATSERLFCPSQATRDDIVAYLGVPPERITVMTPGVRLNPADLSAARCAAPCEPYVAIVGTLTPRRNGRLMLDHLVRDPGFAERYRTVFIGEDEWHDGKDRLFDAAAAAGVAGDRVLFTGYLGERERTALMLNAAFCVYLPIFSGYGLPVLEAAALGRFTVCADTTALPEAAPHASILFDPLDPDSFANALAEAERRAADAPRAQSLATLLDRARAVSAARAYPPIARWVLGR